jgi:hypothetical protein
MHEPSFLEKNLRFDSVPTFQIAEGNFIGIFLCAQSRQSAKLFLKSSELGLPQPLARRRVCHPPPLWFRGEGHTRWRERGWESPNSDEGTYTVVLCKYSYLVLVSIVRNSPSPLLLYTARPQSSPTRIADWDPWCLEPR